MNEKSQDKIVHEEYYPETSGWLMFSAIMMFGISLFAATAAVINFFNSSALQEYSMLGNQANMAYFGAFDGLTAIFAAIAGYGIWKGMKYGFWLGIVMATVSVARWFLFAPGLPLWSFGITIVWILIIYGLVKDRKYFA